jgi:hypothetical protein
VTVNDPGHTHVGIVNDPGHSHLFPLGGDNQPQTMTCPGGLARGSGHVATSTDKTGISVTNLPAKSTVSVSVDANGAGELTQEHLPLVYVLICQKVA